MSVLAPGALAGIRVMADPASSRLAAALRERGAAVEQPGATGQQQHAGPGAGDEPVDLALVAIHGRAALEEVARGDAAADLALAFRTAREAAGRLCTGGCLLFVVYGPDRACAGIASLTRTLALEWASARLRVNAVVCPRPEDAADLIALVAAAPGRMLTGAVIETG